MTVVQKYIYKTRQQCILAFFLQQIIFDFCSGVKSSHNELLDEESFSVEKLLLMTKTMKSQLVIVAFFLYLYNMSMFICTVSRYTSCSPAVMLKKLLLKMKSEILRVTTLMAYCGDAG